MIPDSRPMACALGAAALALLTACASTTTAPQAQTSGVAANSSRAEAKETIIGSRIPSKTTEKLVRQVGAEAAQDMQRTLPPNPGMLNH